ncbi:hypothetical protein BDP55DRAFT_634885 [Colletotrichum godetiae]|uniref:Uncharacterized protein n=1 Tax=Colletotrichum godetiae TaxID=1209918 RepID=A0AAJ0AFP9_9PEZI|nr:uncharacterized protein BDP55DRAFT_634885 [Colletotrichum godetiae]KAK1672374.1 hypothetical protein BDP55DRAFT_634885 [Colletotrichum godetiae]
MWPIPWELEVLRLPQHPNMHELYKKNSDLILPPATKYFLYSSRHWPVPAPASDNEQEDPCAILCQCARGFSCREGHDNDTVPNNEIIFDIAEFALDNTSSYRIISDAESWSQSPENERPLDVDDPGGTGWLAVVVKLGTPSGLRAAPPVVIRAALTAQFQKLEFERNKHSRDHMPLQGLGVGLCTDDNKSHSSTSTYTQVTDLTHVMRKQIGNKMQEDEAGWN